MNELAIELAGIFLEFQTLPSQEELLKILSEEWPDLSQNEVRRIVSSTLRILNAIGFLKRRFPTGRFPGKISDISDTPFDPETLRIAASIINQESVTNSKLLAFPKILKNLSDKKSPDNLR